MAPINVLWFCRLASVTMDPIDKISYDLSYDYPKIDRKFVVSSPVVILHDLSYNSRLNIVLR